MPTPSLARWATKRKTARSDGPRARRFIETFCKPSKDVSAGTIKLRDWQGELLDGALELDEDGNWRHRTGLVGVARKNGKSLLGSAIGLYALVGFGVRGAEVYSVAGDRDQAKIVFNEAAAMVRAEPELDNVLKVYKKAIEFPALNAVWRVLSAEADSAEGLNPLLTIFDEVHVQKKWDLWNVMTQGSATRPSALTLGITTAGHDKETPCYKLYDYGKRCVNGEVEDDSFFFRWWEPHNPDVDFREPKAWAEANPGLGDFQFIRDFQSAAQQADEQGREFAFRRYRLNQWTSSEDAWLPFGTWDRNRDRSVVVPGLPALLQELAV